MPNNHSEEIKVGNVYSYIFAQPGNDTTLAVVKSVSGDSVECLDIYFGHSLILKKDRLLDRSHFAVDEIIAAAKHGCGYQYMIRKTIEHFRTKVFEEAKTEAAIDFQHQVHLNTETFAKLNDAARLLELNGYKWDGEKQAWTK